MEDNSLEKAVVQDSELLNKKIKPVPRKEPNIGIDTDKNLYQNIINAGTTGQIDISAINSFTQISQNRNKLYELLDAMAQDSTISAILETYAEDATEYNDEGQIVWVESADADCAKLVNYLLDSMQVNKHAYEWVYSLCKYGDIYLQLFKNSEYEDNILNFEDSFDDKKKPLNEDIKIKAYKENDKYAHYVEIVNNPAEMFELTRFGKSVGYIKADISVMNKKEDNLISSYMKYRFKKADVTIFDPTKFVHAALRDGVDRQKEEVSLFLTQDDMDSDKGITYTVKHGQSLLYNAYKIWRELSLLENSMLLNRLTKSSVTRVINVEVGDMPKEMVGPHLQGIKQLIEQKSTIDAGSSIGEYTNPGPIENNIYVPVNAGKGAITASQIGGDVNVGQLPDIEYFQNKFFGSVRVPKQYFGLTNDSTGFNGGTSLSIISSRYAKMIKRIQNTLIQAVTDIVNLFLIDKEYTKYINKFTIKMQAPTTQEEIDRRDNLASKVQISSDVMNVASDISDPITRLKMLKSLLSNSITNTEVIELISEEIEKLENELEEGNNIPEGETPDDISVSGGSGGFSSAGLGDGSQYDAGMDDLDAALGLDDEIGDDLDTADLSATSDDTDILPTPEETGLDLSDNNTEI